MPEITMPALSPTMEEGTLARWLKKVGDAVKSGDVLAEIETDKATMEIEAIDEGILTEIRVADGTEGVKVGAVIAVIAGEGEGHLPGAEAPLPQAAERSAPPPPSGGEVAAATLPALGGHGANPARDASVAAVKPNGAAQPAPAPDVASAPTAEDRVVASPLARRIAAMRGIDLAGIAGSGPNGRIVKGDVDRAAAPAPAPAADPAFERRVAPIAAPPLQDTATRGKLWDGAMAAPAALAAEEIPHDTIKLSTMRKVIARRLTQSKQTIPHYYLAIDVRLDPLIALRGELNAALAPRGIKLSVNDMLIKALALALRQVPDANVSFTGDSLLRYGRADISVAVAIPAGLITPIIVGADTARLSDIATAMKDLAARAKDGKLQPHEYQGGTASLSNLGMFGIKQFEAVINPPQGMILAVGAGDRRPWVEEDTIVPATILTATGSFDHRAIDGAVGAQLMAAIKTLIEAPLSMVA